MRAWGKKRVKDPGVLQRGQALGEGESRERSESWSPLIGRYQGRWSFVIEAGPDAIRAVAPSGLTGLLGLGLRHS